MDIAVRPILCVNSASVTAYDRFTRQPTYFASRCRKYSCEFCGPIERFILAKRITKAEPNRLITLTCRHEDGPLIQYDRMKKLFQRFVADIRKKQPFEFMKVLELCKDGYPHFHLLARTPFIEQSTVSELWYRHTKADIVDIRKCHGRSIGYVTKYITKAFTQHEEWKSMSVRQRIGTSHKFYKDTEVQAQQYISFEHCREHPWTYVPEHFGTTLTLERIRKGTYAIVDREAGDELPEELLPPRNEE